MHHSSETKIPVLEILVVEDDREFADVLCKGLRALGHEVLHAACLPDADQALLAQRFDLVLLDLEVAEQDGLALLKGLRAEQDPTPVIIMTGTRISNRETIAGLNLGADDYLAKPFGLDVLNARINAVMRRAQPESAVELSAGDLSIDRIARTAHCGAEPLDLTAREFDLLVLLMEHAGQACSREHLLTTVWKDSIQSTSLNNSLDVHISKLRKKLKNAASGCEIKTEWGRGFVLVC